MGRYKYKRRKYKRKSKVSIFSFFLNKFSLLKSRKKKKYSLIKFKSKKSYRGKVYSQAFDTLTKRRMLSPITMFRTYCMLPLLLAILITELYLLFFSGFFSINDISITGYNRVEKSEYSKIIDSVLNKKIFYIFPSNNILLVNQELILKNVLKKFSVNNVGVEKNIIDKSLMVIIQEKEPVLTVSHNNDYYHIDQTSEVINKIEEETEINRFPVLFLNNDNVETINIGKKVLSPIIVSNLLELNKHLLKIDKFKVSSFKLEETPQVVIRETIIDKEEDEKEITTLASSKKEKQKTMK